MLNQYVNLPHKKISTVKKTFSCRGIFFQINWRQTLPPKKFWQITNPRNNSYKIFTLHSRIVAISLMTCFILISFVGYSSFFIHNPLWWRKALVKVYTTFQSKACIYTLSPVANHVCSSLTFINSDKNDSRLAISFGTNFHPIWMV